MKARDLEPLDGIEHWNPQGAIREVQQRLNDLLGIMQEYEKEAPSGMREPGPPGSFKKEYDSRGRLVSYCELGERTEEG